MPTEEYTTRDTGVGPTKPYPGYRDRQNTHNMHKTKSIGAAKGEVRKNPRVAVCDPLHALASPVDQCDPNSR